MKKLVLLVISVGCLLAAWVGFEGFRYFTLPSSSTKTEVIFEVPPGSVLYGVANELQVKGLIKSARPFVWISRALGAATGIKVGEYRLYTDMTPKQILDVVTSGDSITYPIVVPEGYNIFEIADVLNKQFPGRGDEFLGLARNAEYVEQILGEKRPSLEGYLFPDTYMITKFTAVRELILRMNERYRQTVEEIRAGKNRVSLPENDWVTLASVIEKETGAPEERAKISSVFHNRLQKGMRLQSDPTIIYGMWVETGVMPQNIRKDDILRSTPYNTYTVAALPVGPIANPGKAALAAALNPETTENLYFVSRNDGTHVFTKTYEDHSRAVQNFQINRAAREGKSWRDLKKKDSAQKAKSTTTK